MQKDNEIVFSLAQHQREYKEPLLRIQKEKNQFP
jgi:hypothetical protein